MEGYCSTCQRPQWAVVSMEGTGGEEEEEENIYIYLYIHNNR